MMPESLADDRLYIFVFGPGFGECIAVRVPPSNWIVLDSCKFGGQAAALHLLSRYGGETTCVVLTHPHSDHYSGLSQVLSHADWKVIGCADQRLTADSTRSRNPDAHRRRELDHIFSTISTCWSMNAESRWWTWRESEQGVGEGTLKSLHPTEQFARDNPDAKPNDLSSAMLLEWGRVRLLLGADLENPHWEEISRDIGQLATHAAMKVPHHGSHETAWSRGALHPSFMQGDRTRLWVVTPYSKKKGLPGMADGEGMHQMLKNVDVVYLTGLAVRHDRQADAPCVTTRAACLAGVSPKPTQVSFGGGITGTAIEEMESVKCYIVAEFSEDGVCSGISCGPGSMKFTET